MLAIVQAPTARPLRTRTEKIRAFVIHGTGQTDLKKILRFYQAEDGLCPHYFIASNGTIYQHANEDLIAPHAATGKEEAALYRMGWQNWSRFAWNDGQPKHLGGEFSGYRWWRETWFERGYQSPLDLVTAGKTNATTVGIELQSPSKPLPIGYTEPQYRSLADLLANRGKALGIVPNRETVLSHSDTNPLRRCRADGPFDPGYRFSFLHLWDLITARP